MQTKLTLRMDQHLIEQAKRYAEERGKSLSQIVADYFSQLVDTEETTEQLPTLVNKLKGALAGASVSEQDYLRFLEEKHR